MNKIRLLFIVSFSILAQGASGQCSDLFFSEYIEGSSNNKALEIYNPTGAAIDLTDYAVYRNNNGATSPSTTFLPQGVIASKGVYIIGNASGIAGITAVSDTLHSLTFYNGDDAVYLVKISTGDTLDIIGEIGVDPGSNWTVGTGATGEFTLVRKTTVFQGQTDWSIGSTEWDVFPQNTTDSLGAHTTSPCPAAASGLVITEIMYNPAATADTMEYIEFYNQGTSIVDLTGYTISQGITYTFPSTTVNPGDYVLVARDSAALSNVYGATAFQWASGDNLSNSGEQLVLKDNLGNTIDSVDYDDASPWPLGPPTPDGDGPSIELVDITTDNSLGSNWVVSPTAIAGVLENGLQVYGTPGMAYSTPPIANLVITEIMYNPAAAADTMEYIEFYNNGPNAINMNGYTVSQGISYTFPAVTINSGAYLLIARDSSAISNVYGLTAYEWASGDNLSNSGEQLVLKNNLGNTIDSVDYADSSPWPTSPITPDGDGPSIELVDLTADNGVASSWVASPTAIAGVIENGKQVYGTPGFAFAPPALANLIITEINYNGPESNQDSTEFVEILNAGNTTVNLGGYSITGFTFSFSATDSILPGGYFLLATDSTTFSNKFGFTANGAWTGGSLSNGGELLLILDNFGRTVDSVDFDDGGSWPSGSSAGEPDGGGASIVLCDSLADNSDGANWSAATSATGDTIAGFAIFANPGVKAPCTSPLVISTAIDSNVTCNGLLNGGASASIISGNGSYSYLWSNGDTSATIDSLSAGTYFVTVTDGAALTATDSVVITEPTNLVVSSTVDSLVSCNSFTDGGATGLATGGTAPYTYAWTTATSSIPFATTTAVTGVAAGSFTFVVTDANGCIDSASAMITEPSALISVAAVDSNVTFNGGSNGGATASATGGTPNYTYLWSNSATTASITGVGAGNYFVTITDANGCDDSSSVTITQPTTISLTVTVDSNATCNGNTDGGLTASATGGIAPYTYAWSNAATTASITGVGAATYTVTITDAANITATSSGTISEPNLLVANVAVDSNVSINGGTNGGATVTATGGTSPYTYLWSNSATTASITGVSAGTYSTTITDANGCTELASGTITEPAAIAVTGVVTNISCNGASDGAIDLTVTNGAMPYSYVWSNGDTLQDIDTLIAASYSVTVTDANSTTATASFTVTQPSAIVVNVVVDSNVACNGQMNGGLTATATGGTGNLNYSWNAGNRSLAAQSFESTTNDTWNFGVNPVTYNTEGDSIVAGSDDVWAVIQEFTGNISAASNGNLFWGMQDLENGNGGGAFYHTLTFDPINVSAETGVKFSFDYNSVGFDASDSIQYQVEFNNGTTWDSTGVALNQNTQAWTTVTVDVPDTATFVRVRLQASQNGGSDYAGFDNVRLFTGSSSITGVGAGSYTVTVTDSLGCVSIAAGTITEPTVLSATFTVVDATTVGGSDGSISATVSGGTPAYTYAWSNSATTSNNSALTAGTYFVTITDTNGCSIVDSAVVADPAAIVLVTDSSNVSCFGAADGTAKVVASGGSGTYSYMWSNMATTDSIGGLVPGTYVVTVSDLVGTVTAIDSVVIVEPTPLQLTFAVTNTSATAATDGAIDLTVIGGSPSFNYSWSNAAITEDLTSIGAGTYTVIVTDVNGCQITDSATVLEPGALANLVITEINYNGPESGTDTSEFIEFSNAGSTTVNLNGYSFVEGVSHTFGANDSITPGQYYVIAFDSSSFRNRYGIDADAIWSSGGLSNGGEDITIVDNFGRTIDSVDFESGTPWPANVGTSGPAGNGSSIELQTALNSDNNAGSNWVASALAVPGAVVNTFQVFGSPGNPYITGINNVVSERNEVIVFPNPTRGQVTIETDGNAVQRIQLLSMEGKLLRDMQTANNQVQLDLSELANGVYFLKVGNETRRVVLTR